MTTRLWPGLRSGLGIATLYRNLKPYGFDFLANSQPWAFSMAATMVLVLIKTPSKYSLDLVMLSIYHPYMKRYCTGYYNNVVFQKVWRLGGDLGGREYFTRPTIVSLTLTWRFEVNDPLFTWNEVNDSNQQRNRFRWPYRLLLAIYSRKKFRAIIWGQIIK